MSREPRPAGSPTPGENVGGLIGCLALLIALGMLIALMLRAYWHAAAPKP